MENKNNISKLTKILFVALAMGMILISPYQLCNVAAADKYYGYQKKTQSVKTKITASKKKVRIKKKYRGTRTTKNVESKWSDSYKYTYGDAKKIHIKTVITTKKHITDILLRQSEILKRQLQKIKSILFAIRRKLVLMAEFQVMYRNN